MSILESARKAAGREKKNKGYEGTKLPDTKNMTKDSETTSTEKKSSILESARKAAGRERQSGANYSSAPSSSKSNKTLSGDTPKTPTYQDRKANRSSRIAEIDTEKTRVKTEQTEALAPYIQAYNDAYNSWYVKNRAHTATSADIKARDDAKKKLDEQQEKYKLMLAGLETEKAQLSAAQKTDDVGNKYNIDVKNFDEKQFEKWAIKNGFEKKQGDNGQIWYEPRVSDDYIGIGSFALKGKKLTTEEQEKDFDILFAIAQENYQQKKAIEHPIYSSIETVAAAPLRGVQGVISSVEDSVNVAKGKEIDLFSQNKRLARQTRKIRETVDKEYASKWFGGKELPVIGNVGSALYNVGMSIGDNAVNMAVGAAIGNVASAAGLSATATKNIVSGLTSSLMASDATVNSIITNKERGLSDGKALCLGIASGMIELATEKFSIDKIIENPADSLKKIILKGMAAEGSEEMTSEVLNKMMDGLVNQENSEMQIAIKEYIKNGHSKEEAVALVWGDMFSDILGAGITGAFSGAAMGGTFNAVSTLTDKYQTKQKLKVVEEYKNAVDEKILQFAKFARENKNDNTSKISLQRVSDSAVNDIKNLTGIDVSGYTHSLKANTIHHIDKKHGVNGKTDNSMADDKDLARIQYVLDNYDSVELLPDLSAEYRTKNQEKAPMIKYTKRVNGSYYVVEAVPDTKRQELPIVSVYKNKAVEQRTVDVQAPTSNVQNASADTTLSNNNVSQNGNSVNTQYMQNDTPLAERLELQSRNNESLSVEDVKKATGFGEEGSKLVVRLANSEGVTFRQAKSAVETAYAAGFANVESSKVNFETDTQIDAFTAGKKDWVMQNLAHRTDANQNSVDRFYGGKESNVNSATAKIDGSTENPSVPVEDATNMDADTAENNPARMYEIMDELGLTYDEQSGIIDYKSGESYTVNSLLRGRKKLSDKQQSIKNGLNSALKKFPVYKGRVYRNIGFIAKEDFDSFILEHEKEISVTYSAFTSASKTIDGYVVEAPYLVHYEIESVDGRDVSQIGIKSEKEILFATDTTFEILSIEKNENSLTIKMKEVNQNGKGKSERTLEERGEQRQVQESSSETEYRRTNEEIYSASDVVRGGSAAYDEVYRGTSNSDSRGIDGRSGADNKKSIREAGDAAIREGELLGIDDSDVDKFEGDENTDNLAMWTTKRVGDKVKPKSISEIVATIEHEFGINITTGHIRGNGVLGQYNKDNRGIRTKIANNLPVISHELGHYFERTLAIKSQLSNELIQELKTQLDAGFAANYTDEQIIREGVAEYVRRFLQNRETAAIDYPKFNDFFLKLLPSKDLARIQQLADDINAYYSLDADTGTSSIKLSEEGSIDLRTPMEKLKEKASNLYQALVDSNHAIKRFDRATGSNAYILASNAAYSDAIAGQIVTGDLTDKNGKYISSGLKTVLQGIDLNNKEEYRLFGEYLTVKHGPERLNEGMRIFADDRKNSTNWMQNRQVQLEKQYPQFKKVSERLYAFIKQFYKAWGVDTGLISEATLDNWSERWKYYVPFNRVLEKGKSNFGAKRGFANQNSTIKKARGSGRDIKHPVDNIIENIVKMVNAGVRNDVMRTITTSAEKLGADATFLEQVPMPISVAKMDMTGVKDNLTTWLEESDLDADSKEKANGIVSSLDDILLQYGRGKAFGNVVTVLKNGTPQTWKINDIELLQSLTSLSPKTMDGILDAYAVLSRFMTSNITGTNIIWSIFSNLPRDIGTFFTYSKNKNVVKMAKGMGEAYINKVKRDSADPLYKEFLAMGGGKTSAYTADRNLAKDVRKKLSGRRFNPNPLDWIGFVSDTIETGPRFATYKMMRDAGMTPQEAFYEAMDITVNFRRGGRISKELNKVVPFFNANVQGLDKFRRWITAEEVTGTERKRAVRNRALSFIAVSAALAAMIYAINNGDDEKEEDYEQLSTYIKNSYWVFPTGDGKHFAVPKPREIGVLSSFFETCLEYGVGENDHAFDEFYAYASENLLPAIANDIAQVGSKGLVETGMNIIGSLGMVGVIGYLGANRDFLGRPIVSSGLQNLEKKDQYTDRTSKIAYWLGQAFNGSPEQIDYFFQQILGGWWKGQKALFPVGEKNRDWSLGVGNNYIKDNQYSTDLTNWLYDRADATSRAKKSNPDNIDKAITAKWDSNMVDFYGTYYKKAKNDSKSTAARSTRQLVLDMIREYQKGIDGDYKTSWQEAVEKVCKAKGSTEYMPSVMSAEVTDGNDRKHNLSDIQYVEYQTDYLRLYWETVEETLSNDMTTSEKANILTAAKKVAKEQATECTLNRIGAPSSKFAAKYEGVSNDTIVNFLVALDKYDEPTKTGKYGTYTQEETERAIKQLEGLSQKEKAILWQSVNTSWKASKNPFR